LDSENPKINYFLALEYDNLKTMPQEKYYTLLKNISSN